MEHPTPDSEIPIQSNGVPGATDKTSGSTDERPNVLYKVEWSDLTGSRLQNFQSANPIGPLEVSTGGLDGTTVIQEVLDNIPAIEIITSILGTAPTSARIAQDVDDSDDESADSAEARARVSPNLEPTPILEPDSDDFSAESRPLVRSRVTHKRASTFHRSPVRSRRWRTDLEPIAFKDIKIAEVRPTRIVIHSGDLLQEIRNVVKYYPAQSLTGSPVEIVEPFGVLIHHLDDLEARRGELMKSDDAGRTYKALNALLQYLHYHSHNRLSAMKERLSRPVPVVTFDDLWYLFKPGSDAYAMLFSTFMDNVSFGAVVMKTQVAIPTKAERREGKKQSYKIRMFSLECNGITITRDELTRTIEWFEGERRVTSLPAYPSAYHDDQDGGKRRKALEERGERLYRLLHSQPKQMWHDEFFYTSRKQKYRGPAIIDHNTAIANKDFYDDPETRYGFFLKEITFQSEDSDMLGHSLDTFPWANYHNISVRSTALPSKHHYFLLQPIVPGFALYDKTYKLFNIENLSEVNFQVNMDSLIIDQGNRDIVQAICHANSQPWKIDDVSSKGEGQVALLHGPPGVGKTYTVECIAQATGRPLIALTIGDLMVEEDQVETKLVNWFSLAERWKAILLLDEADIFLERRATRDIQRNGIVSIFLRRMEYFRGLLFLTTNRVGQIDDAFLSRVTVVLQYDHLSDDTRKKIWQGFFKKLEKDSQRSPDARKIEIDRYAQKYVLNDPEVKNLRWNGREIRNALQTAISLASYKALQEGSQSSDIVEIEEEHFKTVVEMSRKFKGYMQSISGKEEGQRAKARMDRNDPQHSTLT